MLEENLQKAKRYGLKEYKSRRKEVYNMELDDALDYLKRCAIEYSNLQKDAKDKQTDDYDYPIREYWNYMAAYRAMQVLMKQLTDSDTKILRN